MAQETLRARFRRRYKASTALRVVTWLFLLVCIVLVVLVLGLLRRHRAGSRRREAAELCPNDADFLLALPGARCTASQNLVQTRVLYRSPQWGNVLSPYWAARAYAELGGFRYSWTNFPNREWIDHLPQQVAADSTKADVPALRRALADCGWLEDGLLFSHQCVPLWIKIIPTIRRDTRAALRRFASQSGATVPFDGADGSQWLIYDRCELCSHDQHGPYQFSIYTAALPADTAVTVTYINSTLPSCRRIQQMRTEYLLRHRPNAQLVAIDRGTRFHDFAAMAFAPNVIIGWAGSSWATWSTLAANSGAVFFGPHARRGVSAGMFAQYDNLHMVEGPMTLFPDVLPTVCSAISAGSSPTERDWDRIRQFLEQ